MRVCILTKGEPYGWTRHYVQAFRRCCDEVLTVGPNIARDELNRYHLGYLYDSFTPTDIETELGPDVVLINLLPPGWEPNLVVAISIAGISLCPIFEGIRCPKVYLSVDTWQSPRDYLDAIAYDFVFAAQREFVPRLRAMGSRRVAWLPLACNPTLHYPVPMAKSAEISFAGTIALPIHQERHDLVTRLQSEFAVNAQSSVYGHALNRLCCSGKLTFNHSAVRDLNMRIFETMAMGVPLLTNRDAAANGLLDLFEDGKHLIGYDDADELMAKARAYLDEDTACRRIASAARTEVLAHHTYEHRVRTIVETVEACVPGFGESSPAPHPQFEIINQIPSAPGVVLDAGAHLQGAAGTIRALGTSKLYAWSPESQATAAGYDEIFTADFIRDHDRQIDTFLIDDVQAPQIALEDIMRLAHEVLTDGGTLLLQVSRAELSALGMDLDAEHMRRWLLKRDFLFVRAKVLVHAETHLAERCVIVARKRTRTLAEVVDETFANLPPNCESVLTSVKEWCQGFPSGI